MSVRNQDAGEAEFTLCLLTFSKLFFDQIMLLSNIEKMLYAGLKYFFLLFLIFGILLIWLIQPHIDKEFYNSRKVCRVGSRKVLLFCENFAI